MKWIIFFVLTLLCLRFILFFSLKPRLLDGQQISFSTILLSDPQTSSRYSRLTANYSNFWGSETISITYSPELRLNYGDEIMVSGRIERQLLSNKQTIMTMYFPKIEAVKNQENLSLFPLKNILAIIAPLRQKIISFCYENLKKEDAGLMVGILLGAKVQFSKEFTLFLRNSGVMHVIAASGMNVTMVAGWFFAIFGRIFRRQIALIISSLGIIFYMLLSGLQASIVRAGIMGILAFGAQIIGRQYNGVYVLFLTISGMLLYNPNYLFDIGFQLSFGATAGIIFLKPILPSSKVFDDLTTTTSAQIGTLPIMLSSFGTYGLLSIPVNFLVLWTVPILMVIGAVASLAGLIFDPLGSLLMRLSVPLLWWFEKVVNFAGSFHIVFIANEFPIILGLGYYMLLISIIIFMKKREVKVKEKKSIES